MRIVLYIVGIIAWVMFAIRMEQGKVMVSLLYLLASILSFVTSIIRYYDDRKNNK